MRKVITALLLLSATSLTAASITIGTMESHGSVSYSNGNPSNPAFTIIDGSHPATAAGTITNASVRWSLPASGPCVNAFKVKFIRPGATFGTFTVLTERGPFSATAFVTDVPIFPNVPVLAGDLIAVTQLQPATCGGALLTYADPSSVAFTTSGDLLSGSFANMNLSRGVTLNAIGSSDSTYLAGILTAAGAAAGVGSFFRTSVQLANPSPGTMTGRLVYHPAGRSASDSDPSLPYTIPPSGTFAQNDVATALGQSGLGSIDVIVITGGPPFVLARVFNDQGDNGTSGFVEPLQKVTDAMSSSYSGTIVLPSDFIAFRVNVGVRTLGDGATLALAYTSANNSQVAVPSMSFPPNYFIQMPVATLVSGAPIKPNGQVSVQVTAGSAIVYVSIIDNKTGDSSVYFLGRQ